MPRNVRDYSEPVPPAGTSALGYRPAPPHAVTPARACRNRPRAETKAVLSPSAVHCRVITTRVSARPPRLCPRPSQARTPIPVDLHPLRAEVLVPWDLSCHSSLPRAGRDATVTVRLFVEGHGVRVSSLSRSPTPQRTWCLDRDSTQCFLQLSAGTRFRHASLARRDTCSESLRVRRARASGPRPA